jgi:D-alanine-D-alanine ligase
MGFETEKIGNIRHLTKALAKGRSWDMVFNICEGVSGFGREAQVPALLDAWDIPYVFSDPLIMSLTLHKAMTKIVVRYAGVIKEEDPQNKSRKYASYIPIWA